MGTCVALPTERPGGDTGLDRHICISGGPVGDGHGGDDGRMAALGGRPPPIKWPPSTPRRTRRSRRRGCMPPSGRAQPSRSSGTYPEQSSIATGHRVWNTHPDGGFSGLGISPSSTIRSLRRSNSGSGIGMAERSALVYGCSGFSYKSSQFANSTILPRYITATRSLMCRTTDRSCAMNR